jgi:hypothetical protein
MWLIWLASWLTIGLNVVCTAISLGVRKCMEFLERQCSRQLHTENLALCSSANYFTGQICVRESVKSRVWHSWMFFKTENIQSFISPFNVHEYIGILCYVMLTLVPLKLEEHRIRTILPFGMYNKKMLNWISAFALVNARKKAYIRVCPTSQSRIMCHY